MGTTGVTLARNLKLSRLIISATGCNPLQLPVKLLGATGHSTQFKVHTTKSEQKYALNWASYALIRRLYRRYDNFLWWSNCSLIVLVKRPDRNTRARLGRLRSEDSNRNVTVIR
jgi:hypothetical protein